MKTLLLITTVTILTLQAAPAWVKDQEKIAGKLYNEKYPKEKILKLYRITPAEGRPWYATNGNVLGRDYPFDLIVKQKSGKCQLFASSLRCSGQESAKVSTCKSVSTHESAEVACHPPYDYVKEDTLFNALDGVEKAFSFF